MAKVLERERIEAALKRAASKAKYGTREQRSGRLIVRDDRTGQFVSRADAVRKVKPSTKA